MKPSFDLRRAGLMALALLLTLAADAEPAGELQTADGVVRAVLAANPGLQAAQAAVAEARARAESAGRLDDPHLSYLLAPQTVGSGLGDRHVLQLAQSLPWPGTLADRRAAAEERRQAVAWRERERVLELEQLSRTLFAEWRHAHAALAINRRQQGLVETLAAAAQSRYASGRGSQAHVLQARLQIERLKQDELRWQAQIAGWQAQLNALLGRPAGAELPAPLTTPAAPPALSAPDAGDAPVPSVAALEAERAAAETGVMLARRKRLPDLRLMANYLGTLDPQEKRLQLGVGINLPLGFRRLQAEEDAARAALQRARYAVADERARVDAQRSRAAAEYERAQRSIELIEHSLLPLARDNLQAALAAYRAGGGSFSDVIDAEQRLLQAEMDHSRAVSDRARAAADWRRWAGVFGVPVSN